MSDTEVLQQLLDMCDILVCPSFAEGMPTVVLEAMARGLAIIATDVGATAEWVDDQNGRLVPSPRGAALSNAFTTFLAMPALQLHQLQLASVAKARSYTWEIVAEAVLNAVSGQVLLRQ
jgi:glycosyltransferase involved in cell wall biosynthesis